jgi:hypothetical protein
LSGYHLWAQQRGRLASGLPEELENRRFDPNWEVTHHRVKMTDWR